MNPPMRVHYPQKHILLFNPNFISGPGIFFLLQTAIFFSIQIVLSFSVTKHEYFLISLWLKTQKIFWYGCPENHIQMKKAVVSPYIFVKFRKPLFQ